MPAGEEFLWILPDPSYAPPRTDLLPGVVAAEVTGTVLCFFQGGLEGEGGLSLECMVPAHWSLPSPTLSVLPHALTRSVGPSGFLTSYSQTMVTRTTASGFLI